MAGFDDPAFFGDTWAQAYSDLTFGPAPERAVEFLATLPESAGRVLELGIGGGRMALPLARRGIKVEGIEASQAVLDRLRATPGGEAIPVTVGDMADVPADGPFDLVYLVLGWPVPPADPGTPGDLLPQRGAGAGPGGVFVLECRVPTPALFDRGVEVNTVTEGRASLTLTRHNPVAQRSSRSWWATDGERVQVFPVAMRYCWPSQLDLMAEMAALRLRERYADWSRTPFGPASGGHVSMYELPDPEGSRGEAPVRDQPPEVAYHGHESRPDIDTSLR